MSASNTAHVPMDEPHLSRYGANAARALELEGAVRPGTVAREMRRALAEVERARQELARWAEESGRTPGAVEWLLDNAYLAAREGRMAERAFRRGRPLRRCRNGQSVLQCAARTALWAVPDLDRRRLTVFLSAFQSVLPLTERELSLLVPALTWALLCQLRGLCGDLAALREEQTGPAPFESVFAGLRALSDGDWGALLESESRVEAVLRQDPAGCYGSMEDATRRRYRGQVCRLARKSGMGEEETARRVLELSRQGAGAERHVGWFLFRRPLGAEKRTRSGACYGPLVLLSAALLSAALALLLDSWVGGLLLFFPLSDLVKNSADFLLVRLVPPRPVHRMALESGIPPEGRTLCVIAALLTGKESGRELAEKLERYHLANRDSGGELRLGMLADLPDRDAPMGAEGRSWVREARKEVDRLNRVITDLIGLSRPSDVRPRPVCLENVVAHVMRLIRQDAEQRNVRLEYRTSRRVPNVLVDSERMGQALLNLCLNALDAMPDGGRMTLVIAKARRRVCLMVRDTGKGIDPAAMAHIFDPYFTTKGQGTGLGLAMVHKIVAAHNGEISVYSRLAGEDGHGETIFRLWLPLAPKAPEEFPELRYRGKGRKN